MTPVKSESRDIFFNELVSEETFDLDGLFVLALRCRFYSAQPEVPQQDLPSRLKNVFVKLQPSGVLEHWLSAR